MLATDTMLAIFVCLASIWYIFYVSLQSFMTCGQSVKEFSFISYFLFLINLQRALPSSLSLPDRYGYATNLMVYIKRRWWSTSRGEGWHDDGVDPCRGEGWQVTWYRWWPIGMRGVTWWQRRGVTWWWWWYLIIFFRKKRIISLATVSLLWLGSLPSLPLMCAKASLMVVKYMLTRLMNIDSPVGDKNRLFMESWYFWKASHHFCWRCNFRVNIFFAVSFFASSFSLIFSPTSMNCATLAAVR